MNDIQTFLQILRSDPSQISFEQTIALIDQNYDFIPSKFTNGNITNLQNENNNSCKIFAFSQLHNLSKLETLQLFGEYYQEILRNNSLNHPNIRAFVQTGENGIKFENQVLFAKN